MVCGIGFSEAKAFLMIDDDEKGIQETPCCHIGFAAITPRSAAYRHVGRFGGTCVKNQVSCN